MDFPSKTLLHALDSDDVVVPDRRTYLRLTRGGLVRSREQLSEGATRLRGCRDRYCNPEAYYDNEVVSRLEVCIVLSLGSVSTLTSWTSSSISSSGMPSFPSIISSRLDPGGLESPPLDVGGPVVRDPPNRVRDQSHLARSRSKVVAIEEGREGGGRTCEGTGDVVDVVDELVVPVLRRTIWFRQTIRARELTVSGGPGEVGLRE